MGTTCISESSVMQLFRINCDVASYILLQSQFAEAGNGFLLITAVPTAASVRNEIPMMQEGSDRGRLLIAYVVQS